VAAVFPQFRQVISDVIKGPRLRREVVLRPVVVDEIR